MLLKAAMIFVGSFCATVGSICIYQSFRITHSSWDFWAGLIFAVGGVYLLSAIPKIRH